jgi:hypothetical protein
VAASVPCNRALPAGRSAGRSSVGRNTWYAVLKNTLAVPVPNATANRCGNDNAPATTAAGTLT